MKRIILFVLLFAALKVAGQTTGYLRFDTVRIMKQGGACELYLINKTKDTLGLLTNIGGGLTQFKRSRALNDSTIVVGLDTLIIKGVGGGGSVNNRFSVTKGTSDSLQLLNDERTVKRNHSYTTMNDGTRRWNPSYWSFIDKYYADTATEDQSNVGGSTTVKLSNGTWLTAYTGFGDNPEDGGSSTIYAMNSNDNLRTFYNKRQIVALDTLEAHFGPSLYIKGANVSTGDTVILIWATQINATAFNYVGDIRMRQSNDGGTTWGSISIIHAVAGEYYNNFPNRIFKTGSGKLIYPFERLRPGSVEPTITAGFDPFFLYSSNNGSTWSYSTAIPNAPDSGTVETGFYQRQGETRVFWYGRSLRKLYVYTSYSDDDGVTWTTPDYMNYGAPNASTTIKYVSSIDAFLGFSNRVNGTGSFGKRKYLNGFLSNDGTTFKQAFSLDSTIDNGSVIGLSDIIDLDSAIVVVYSQIAPTSNWGSMKVARIPRANINYQFENYGSGISIPSGDDAGRIADYLPIIRWNTTGYYEGSAGAGNGYGTLPLVGSSITQNYPFKALNLKSTGQSGSLTLLNQDNTTATFNRYEITKLFNNSGNLGEGTTVGTFGFNTMTTMRGISSANTTGGFSTIDWTLWSTNAAGTNAERMRVTAEGKVGIGTDVPSTKLHLVGTARFDLGSDANYDVYYRNSSGQFTRLAASTDGYVLTTHSTSSAPTWEAPSSGGDGIYGGNGSLPSDVTVTGGNNSLTFDDIFGFKIRSDYNVISKANGTGIYTEAIAGSPNQYWLGYTPSEGVFSKGAGIIIDTNENVGIGASPPTTMPLYATGASLFVQGFQSNQGNFYKVSNTTTDITASLAAYFYTIDASGGNVTITLPAASAAFGNTMGITYKFQRTDNSGNTVTIQRAGSDTINGATSFTLTSQYQVKQLQCTSTSAWAQW